MKKQKIIIVEFDHDLIDPATYTGPQMDKWFALFRAYEAANRPPIHIPSATILHDFDLFAFSDRFTLVNPDTLMLREMSRHAILGSSAV